MTTGQAQKVVAVSAMGVGALGLFHSVQTTVQKTGSVNGSLPSSRFFVGWGFSYTVISVILDLGGGDLAAGFAILILISALIFEGEDLTAWITTRSKGQQLKPLKHQNQRVKNPPAFQRAQIHALDTLDTIDTQGN